MSNQHWDEWEDLSGRQLLPGQRVVVSRGGGSTGASFLSVGEITNFTKTGITVALEDFGYKKRQYPGKQNIKYHSSKFFIVS